MYQEKSVTSREKFTNFKIIITKCDKYCIYYKKFITFDS